MKHYIGIDLGTTNSAICSYDGKNVRIWKSPEQNDVTPSAIYIDRRGNRYYGSKAYNQAQNNPNNSATLFKRFMGTNNRMRFENAGIEMTPEECSAEILKLLYGYLPEEIRRDPETAVVITVPAAFNQMKKNATLDAAKMAGIEQVALMQEPVAAIMSVMRVSRVEGLFLVYDLGGGTFDISVAENIGGRVNLLSHGGIEMCGGRDIDRMIFSRIVRPWLTQHFELPDDFMVNKRYRKFCRIAQWAVEQAKIELSATESATIALSEDQVNVTDEDDEEMYLDIELTRGMLDDIMAELIDKTIEATRMTLAEANLSAHDIERIVFVGGPTNYKPLRDRVAGELAIAVDTDVNPMTAVAEGASIYAESIDWSSGRHERKASKEMVQTDIGLALKYDARTPGDRARVLCTTNGSCNGWTIEFTSLDTGWTSGRSALKDRLTAELPLEQRGDNRFSVRIYDAYGREQPSAAKQIVVTKTLAAVGAIPASNTVSLEVLEKLDGPRTLETLVSKGDDLPRKGIVRVKAGQTIRPRSGNRLIFNLWEGEIPSPIEDNRYIGTMSISAGDLEGAGITVGTDIECEYEMSDAGTLNITISVPSLGASFTKHNFYCRQDGQKDLRGEGYLSGEGQRMLERIDDMAEHIDDPRLDSARKKADQAAKLQDAVAVDEEDLRQAESELQESRQLLSSVREAHLTQCRKLELDDCVNSYETLVKPYATEDEIRSFETLTRTAQRALERDDPEFDSVLSAMHSKQLSTLVRLDWFNIALYRNMTASPDGYTDRREFARLKQIGDRALAQGDIEELKRVIGGLFDIQIHTESVTDMKNLTNIIKG